MDPLTLTVSLDNGTILKKVKFDATKQVYDALKVIEDKIFDGASGDGFGLFLTSAEDQKTGIWLEPEKTLEYYMLRDGDTIHYMNRIRTLRLRMLDGSVKTLKVDDSFVVNNLMVQICSKIGITNHDEYALCRETKETDVSEDTKSIGPSESLTLKRKTPHGHVMTTLERDTKMEQLRKKLKTDEEVQWVDPNKTLREQSIDPDETLLLKRRLFFSDRNVDSRDPVQLNLLYVQARDAILDGTHPVTQDQAIQFAGIQCQVQFGDHDDVKHTCELIDSSLKDFLPEHYIRVRGIEKSILKEHKKHISLSELDAKMLYNKNARSLTTYGVTFFLVKEKQKGKNKLVPRLLGINAESVIRVDETTRHILEIWPLTQVKKWAPTTTTFTLDFGEYSKQLYTVQTTEAPRIIEVLTGYIDIILKKKHGRDYRGVDFDKYGQLHQETVQPHNANIVQHISVAGQKPITEHFTGVYHHTPDGTNKKVITVHQQNNATHMTQVTHGGIKRAGFKSAVPHHLVVNELKLRQRTVPKLLNHINVSAQRMSIICEDDEKMKVEELEDEMDHLNKYVNELSQGIKDKTEDMNDKAKAIVMHQFEIISAYNKQLASLNISEMQSATAKLTDATTKLYFLMDPETNRRSQLLSASRKSFIEEDKATDKRMSKVLNQGIQDICENINAAERQLDQDVNQPILSKEHLQQLKIRTANNLAQANAAAAVLLAAHVDPKDVDYSAAVMSINTMSELVPNIIGDIKLISRVMPDKKRKLMLKNLHNHCEIMKELCSSPKTHNIEEIHKAAQKFALESERLFSNIDVDVNPNLMHEIIRLAKVVGGKTSKLLLAANKAVVAADPHTSAAIKRASTDITHSSRRLITCAELTAPTIYEPHCQSAMLSATEGVRTSVMALEHSFKPVIDGSQHQDLASDLAYHTAEVEHALDHLKSACNPPSTQFAFNINESEVYENTMDVDQEDEIGLYLKDVAQDAAHRLQTAQQDIFHTNEAVDVPSEEDAELLEREIEELLAVANGAVGDLAMGHTDSKSNNKMPVIVSMNTLVSTLPLIVKGVRRLTSNRDDDLRELFHSTRQLCLVDPQNVNDACSKYGDASAKVLYSISSHCNPENEKPIINLSTAIALKVSDLLSQTNDSINTVEDEKVKDNIEEAGVICAETVQRFISCAKVTSPTIQELCCRISFISAVKEVKQVLSNLMVLLPKNKQLLDGWTDAENMLSNLQSENAKNAAQSLLLAHQKHLKVHSSQKPRKDIEELAKKLAELVRTLELAEEKAKEKPFDPIIQKDLENAMNALQDTLKVMQRTSDDHNQMVQEFTVDLNTAHKLSNNSDTLANESNPVVVDKLVKNIIQDINILSKVQKSPRAQSNLEHLSQRLAAAARALEVTKRKLNAHPNDSNLQNELENAIKNVHCIANEVQTSFQQLPKTEHKFVLTNKTDLGKRLSNELLLKTDAENILHNTKPVIIKEITKKMLENLQKESIKPKSSEDRFKLNRLAQKLADAAQALEKAESKALANPNDVQTQNELQNAVKNIQIIANEISDDFTIPTEESQLSLPKYIHDTNVHPLISSSKRIINQTDPEFIAREIQILQNNLKSLYDQKSTAQSKKDIEQLGDRLADAAAALDLAVLKAKDNAQDIQLKINLQTSIAEVQKIANEINDNCNSINGDINKSILNIDPNNIHELTIMSEKINKTRDPIVVKDTTKLLINNLKSISNTNNSQNLNHILQRLNEAARNLDMAEEKTQNTPANLQFQNDVQNAVTDIQKITNDIIALVSMENEPPLLYVEPNTIQIFNTNYEKLTNASTSKEIHDVTECMINDLKVLSHLQKSSSTQRSLEHFAQKFIVGDQCLKLAEEKAKSNIHDLESQKEIKKCVTNIHNIANELKKVIPLTLTFDSSLVNAKPGSIQNLKYIYEKLACATDPSVICVEAKCLLHNLTNLTKIQKSPQINNNLEHFAQRLSEAAQSLEIAEKKLKENPHNVEMQKEVKNSIYVIHNIRDDLKKFIPTFCEEEPKPFLCVKPNSIQNLKSNYIKLINVSDPKIVCETTKHLLKDLANLSAIQKSSQIRNNIELYMQKLAGTARNLQLTEIKSKEKPHDKHLHDDIQKAVCNVHNVANELITIIPPLSTEIETSLLYLKPKTIKDLSYKTEILAKSNDPKVVAETTRLLITDLEDLSKIQTADQTRKNLEYFAQKLTDAARALEEADVKAKDAPRDVLLQEDVQNGIAGIQKIVSKLYKDIPLLSEEIKTLVPQNKDLHNSDESIEIVMDKNKTSDIKISPDSGNLIILSAENVKNSKQSNDTKKLSRLLINDLQNVSNTESIPETRKYLEETIKVLTEATEALEQAEKLTNQQPNDLTLKKQHQNAFKNVHKIAEEIHKEVSDILCDKWRSARATKLPPCYAKTLLASSQAVLRQPPPKLVEHARRLLNNIQNIDKTAITEEARSNLDDYAKEMLANIQALEIAETNLLGKSNGENSRKEIQNIIDEIHKMSNDLYNDITKSNPVISNRPVKITPKLGQVLKASADTIKLSLEAKEVEERALVLVNDIQNILKEEKSTEARKNLQYFAQKLANAAASLKIVDQRAKSDPKNKTIKMELNSVVSHVCNIADELQYSLECSTIPNTKINTSRPPIPTRKSITERQFYSKESMTFINSEKKWSAKCDQIPFDINEYNTTTLQVLSKTLEDLLKEKDVNNSIKHIDALLNDLKGNGQQPIKTNNQISDPKKIELFAQALARAAKELQDAENKFKIKPQDKQFKNKVEAAKYKFRGLIEDLQQIINNESTTIKQEDKQDVPHDIYITLINAEELIAKLKAMLNNVSPLTIKSYAEAVIHCIQKEAVIQKTKEAQEILDDYAHQFNNALKTMERNEKDNTEDKAENENKCMNSLKKVANEFMKNIIGIMKIQTENKVNKHGRDIDIKQFIDSIKNIEDSEQFDINNEFIDYLVKQIHDLGQQQTLPDKRMILDEYATKVDSARKALVSALKNASNNKDVKSKEQVQKASQELTNILHLIQNELLLTKEDNVKGSPIEIRITLNDADGLINNVDAAIKLDQISLVKSITDDIRTQAANQKSDLAKDYLNQYAERLSEAEKGFIETERCHRTLPGLKVDKLQESRLKIMDTLREFQRDILMPLNKQKNHQPCQSESQQTVHSIIKKDEQQNIPLGICISLTNAEEIMTKLRAMINEDSPIKVNSYAENVKDCIQKQTATQSTKEAQQVLDNYVQTFNNAIAEMERAQKDNTGVDKAQKIKTCMNSLKEVAKEFNEHVIATIEPEIKSDDHDLEIKQFIDSLKDIDDKQHTINNQFIDSLIKQIRDLGQHQTLPEKRLILDEYATKVDLARTALSSAQKDALNNKDIKFKVKVEKASQELINILHLIQNELLLTKKDNVKGSPIEIRITLNDADGLINNVDAAIKLDQISLVKSITDDIRTQAANQKSDLAKDYLNQYAERLSEAEKGFIETERCHRTLPGLKVDKLQESRLKIMDTLREFQRDILMPLNKQKNHQPCQSESQQTVHSIIKKDEQQNIPLGICISLTNAEEIMTKLRAMINEDSPIKVNSYAENVKDCIQKQTATQSTKEAQQVLDNYVQTFNNAIAKMERAQKDNTGVDKAQKIKTCMNSLKEVAKEFNEHVIATIEPEIKSDDHDLEIKQFIDSLKDIDDKQHTINNQFIDSLIKQIRDLGQHQTLPEKRLILDEYATKVDLARTALSSAQKDALNNKDIKFKVKVEKASQELINILHLIQNELLLTKKDNVKGSPIEIRITLNDADGLINNVDAAIKLDQMNLVRSITDDIRIQAANQKSDLAKDYLNQFAQKLSETEREYLDIEQCHTTLPGLMTYRLQDSRLKLMDTLKEFQRLILTPLTGDKVDDSQQTLVQQTLNSLMSTKDVPETLNQVDVLVKNIKQMDNIPEMPKSHRNNLENYAQVLKAAAEALKLAQQQAKLNPKDVKSQIAVKEAKVILLKIANEYLSVVKPVEETQKQHSLSEVETKVVKKRVIDDLSRINTSALKLISEYNLNWSYLAPNEGSQDLSLWNLQPNVTTDNVDIDKRTLKTVADELSELCPRIYKDVAVLSETESTKLSTDCNNKVNLIKTSVGSLCRSADHNVEDVYQNFVLLEDATSSLIRSLDCADDDNVVQLRSNAKEILHTSMSVVGNSRSLSEKTSDARLSEHLYHQSKHYEQLVLQHYFNTMILSPVMNSIDSKKVMASSISDIEENITKIEENVKNLPLEPKYNSTKEEILQQLESSERMIKVTKDLTNNDVNAQSLYLLEIIEDLVNNRTTENSEDTLKVIQNVNLLTAIIENRPQVQEGSSINNTKKYIEKLKVITSEINNLEADVNRSPKDVLKRKRLNESIKMLHHLLLVILLNKEMYTATDVAKLIKGLSSENQILSSNIEDVIKRTKGTADGKETEKLDVILVRNKKLNNIFNNITSEIDFADNAYEYVEAYKPSHEELVLAEMKVKNHRLKDVLRLSSTKIHSLCNSIIFFVAKIRTKHNCISLNDALDSIDNLEKDLDILLKDDETIEYTSEGNEIYRFYAHEAKREICLQAYNLIDTPNVNKVCLKIITHLCVYIHNVRLQINVAGSNDKLRSISSVRRIILAIKILFVQIFNYYIYGANGKFPLSYARRITNELMKELNFEMETKNNFVQNVQKICNLNATDPAESDSDTQMNITKTKQSFTENVNKLNSLVSTFPKYCSKSEELERIQTDVTATFQVVSALVTQMCRPRGVTEPAAAQPELYKLNSGLISLLWTSHFVHYNQNNIASRRYLTQYCFNFNDYLNELVKVMMPSDMLQQQCVANMRNIKMLQVVLHDKAHPINGDGYAHSVDVIKSLRPQFDKIDVKNINKNNLEKCLSEDLHLMKECVNYANQCSYLISISGTEKSIAQNGFIDTHTLLRLANEVQASCISLQCTATDTDFKELCSDTVELTSVICEASIKICDIIKARNMSEGKQEWSKDVGQLARTASKFAMALQAEHAELNKAEIISASISLNKAVSKLVILVKQTTFTPVSPDLTPELTEHCNVIIETTRNMIGKYTIFVYNVKSKITTLDTHAVVDQSIVTSRADFISAYDALVENLRESGGKCALIGVGEQNEDTLGYLDTQINLSKRWLQKPKIVKYKIPGEEAVKNIIAVAETVTSDFKDQETEDMTQTTQDTKRLLEECSTHPDEDKCRNLLDKTLDLKRVIEKTVVNRVVESLNDDDKVQDVKTTVLCETDDSLEDKISALLNHLAQMCTTARVVVTIRGGGKGASQSLLDDTLKAELLAPKLVQAAKLTIGSPKDLALRDGFNFTFNEYYDTVSRVRDLCDRSVDPLDFVRSAGETMHKLSEKSKDSADPRQAFRTNAEITRLGTRVMLVGASERSRTADPERAAALRAAQRGLRAALPALPANLPDTDWTHTTSQILRGAGEVESALGGENIFKQDINSDQPIFMAAHALHACVREWSARDNAIVEAARRAAVLMAKLSTYMAQDKKDASIRTAKEIVEASSEVTRLARKLSLECTDLRIRKNLQQVSEQIPTISGQLKMLSSVKATKNANVEEDAEAMAMLVDNAQNLMLSVEQVVKAAAAASVKIESERGSGRMRWVRARRYQ